MVRSKCDVLSVSVFLQLHKSVITAFHKSSLRCKEADPGPGLWLSFRESLARLPTFNVKLSEPPPPRGDLCKRPRGIPKATSMGRYPAFLSAAPHSLSLLMWRDRGSCTEQLSFCALRLSRVFFAPSLQPTVCTSKDGSLCNHCWHLSFTQPQVGTVMYYQPCLLQVMFT